MVADLPPACSVEIHAECLPRDLSEVLDLAEPWEQDAIDAITESTVGRRTLVDVTTGGDCGWAHFDRCDLGLGYGPDAHWERLAWLYSDSSASVQLARWRDLVSRAVGTSPLDPVLSAALANSLGSHGLIRLGERCRWERRCVRRGYVGSSRHRARRWAAAERRGPDAVRSDR